MSRYAYDKDTKVSTLIAGSEPPVTIAGVENTSTASQAYVIGEYLVYQGFLYKVISPIAQGNTLVVGTNIQVTTVGDELTEINEQIKELNYYSYKSVPLSGFVYGLAVCRKGGMVTYSYDSDITSLVSGQSATLGTLPVGYRPVTQVRLYRQQGPSSMILMMINPDGSISCYNYGAAISSTIGCRFGTTVAVTNDPIPS